MSIKKKKQPPDPFLVSGLQSVQWFQTTEAIFTYFDGSLMVNASNIISGIIISKNIEVGLKVKHKLLNIVHNCKVNITLSKLAFMKYTL